MEYNLFYKKAASTDDKLRAQMLICQYTDMVYQVLNISSYKISVCMCVHEKVFFSEIWKGYSLIAQGMWMSQHILILLLLLKQTLRDHNNLKNQLLLNFSTTADLKAHGLLPNRC